jgi:hypothetical protein
MRVIWERLVLYFTHVVLIALDGLFCLCWAGLQVCYHFAYHWIMDHGQSSWFDQALTYAFQGLFGLVTFYAIAEAILKAHKNPPHSGSAG